MDVVIVGAGIIGVSTAYHLAKSGADCVVVDRASVSSGSSAACGGSILTQTKPAGEKLKLTMHSIKLYRRLRQEMDIEYNSGGMILAETEDEAAYLHGLISTQAKFGNEIAWVDGAELRRRQPYAAGHVVGATFCAIDGEVNPFGVTLSLADAAARQGAVIRRLAEVTKIGLTGNRVDHVETSAGRINCRWVVICAGVWSREVGRLAGVDIPVTARRGEMLVTESSRARLIFGKVLSAGYLQSKHGPRDGFTAGLAIGQSHSGNVVIGSSREEAIELHTRTSPRGLSRVGAEAVRLFPVLRQLRIIRAFSGLRPVSATGYPIIQPSVRVNGLWMATGHEGDGIALAPATGELVVQGITNDQNLTPFPILDI